MNDWYFNPLIGPLIAFVTGILSSLTPCVYPMIPIVLTGFISEKDGSPIRQFLIFWLGLSLTFTSLALVAVVTGQLFGFMGASPAPYALMALILGYSSGSVFGLTPVLRLPQWSVAQKPLLLGLSSGFIASPCTTPYLTLILGQVSRTQSFVLGFLLMLFYALGMGMPFLLMAILWSSGRRLPKAGMWLVHLYKLYGLLLLILAIWYASQALRLFFERNAYNVSTCSPILSAESSLLDCWFGYLCLDEFAIPLVTQW